MNSALKMMVVLVAVCVLINQSNAWFRRRNRSRSGEISLLRDRRLNAEANNNLNQDDLQMQEREVKDALDDLNELRALHNLLSKGKLNDD